jgi:hypothetical protein
MAELIAFGRQCTRAVVTQKEARDAARRVHLSGHGGTNDGMIGAAAAVGLTASGWSGRFIELSNLRAFGEHVSVAELTALGIHTLSIDRDATLPDPLDLVNTKKWVRPRMVAHRPLLLIRPAGDGIWENIDRKNKKRCHGPENSRLKKR